MTNRVDFLCYLDHKTFPSGLVSYFNVTHFSGCLESQLQQIKEGHDTVTFTMRPYTVERALS